MNAVTFRRTTAAAKTALVDAIVLVGTVSLPMSWFLFARGWDGGGPLMMFVSLAFAVGGGIRFGTRAHNSRGAGRVASIVLLILLIVGFVSPYLPGPDLYRRLHNWGFRGRMEHTVGLARLQQIAMEALDRNRSAVDDPNRVSLDLAGQWDFPHSVETPDYLKDLDRFEPNEVRLTKMHGEGCCLEVFVGGGFLEYMAILAGPPGFVADKDRYVEKWADGIYFASN